MDTCGAEEARNQLPTLLDHARDGRPTLVTRRGEPVAIIIAPDTLPVTRCAPGLLSLAGTGRGLWGADPTAEITRQRGEWR